METSYLDSQFNTFHKVCALLVVVVVIISVWFCLKDKFYYGVIIETMIVGKITRENALNAKRQDGNVRCHDPQEDQNLKKRQNSLQMEKK